MRDKIPVKHCIQARGHNIFQALLTAKAALIDRNECHARPAVLTLRVSLAALQQSSLGILHTARAAFTYTQRYDSAFNS